METLTLTAIISVAVSAAVSGFFVYLYQRKLQQVQFENDYRQKSSIVAEMFSIWLQGSNSSKSMKTLTPDDFKKLNKLCWECSFWLPNNIIVDINNRLMNHPGAKDLKEIITDVRQYLNPSLDKIDWQGIVHF